MNGPVLEADRPAKLTVATIWEPRGSLQGAALNRFGHQNEHRALPLKEQVQAPAMDLGMKNPSDALADDGVFFFSPPVDLEPSAHPRFG